MSPESPAFPVYLDDGDAPSKRAVVTAALRLFVKQGMAGTTVREIAAEAGFTNPVLFKYFAGRDELAAFLFERCYRTFSVRLHGALAGDRPFAAQLKALVGTFTRSMDEDLDAHLFVQENLRQMWLSAKADLRRHSIFRIILRLFEEGRAQEAIDPTLDPRLLTVAAIGVMGQLARSLYFHELPSARAVDLQEEIYRLLSNLIRKPR